MARVISLTDKLSQDRPRLIIGDLEVEVDHRFSTVTKIEETMAASENMNDMLKAIELAIGAEACEKLDLVNQPIDTFKVLLIGIISAVQNIPFEEASARFRI